MKLDLPNAEILTKVRDANCLTEQELESLSAAITEIQVRRELDAVDSRWENDMKKFVSLRRLKGGKERLVLISRDEVFGSMLVGFGIASYGSYMIWQFFQDPKKADYSFDLLPLLFFTFFLAVGTWIVITSSRKFRIVSEYEQGHIEYLSKRKQLTAQLSDESRLPVRYCPNCLSQVWHNNRHPSSPPW